MKLDICGNDKTLYSAHGEYEPGDQALEPCPFCGGMDIEVDNTHTPHYTAICQTCGAEKPAADSRSSGNHSKTKAACRRAHRRSFQSAIDEWNKRA